MTKKRIISFGLIIMVLVTLICAITGCGSPDEIPIPKVEENVYIYDQDDIIDDVVEKQLNQMLVELEEKTGVEFAVISIESLLGRTIEEYSNEVFNTLGIGKKGKDNGILLIFSRFDKRVRIEVGRGLEDVLIDSKCGKLLDKNFVPYRESDEYTKATEKTVEAILNVFAEEYSISIQDLENTSSLEDETETKNEWSWLTIAIIVVLLVLIILGCIFFDDSSGGGYSGGSFGGDFGGSFGGFGGGCSGGGGASR